MSTDTQVDRHIDTIHALAEDMIQAAKWLELHATLLAELDAVPSMGTINMHPNINVYNDEGDRDDEASRANAIRTLGLLSKAMARINEVHKTSDDNLYTLSTSRREGYPRLRFQAYVASDSVCTFTETDEIEEYEVVDYIPVTSTKLRPVRTKICPPSLLAGIEVD